MIMLYLKMTGRVLCILLGVHAAVKCEVDKVLSLKAVGSGETHVLELSSDEVFVYALQNHRCVAQWQSEISEARARARDAGLLEAPEVQLSYLSDAATGGDGKQTTALGLSQAIPLGKKRQVERAHAEQLIRQAEANYLENLRNLKKSIDLEIANLHYLKLKNNIMNEMLDNNRKIFSFLESSANIGEVSAIDVGEAELELEVIRQDIQALDVTQQQHLFALKNSLGLGLDWSLVIHSHEVMFKLSQADLPLMDERTIKQHPLVLLHQIDLALAENEMRAVQTMRWGDLTVGLNYEYEREPMLVGAVDQNHSLGFELELPWPVRKPYQGRTEASILVAHRRQTMLKDVVSNIEHEERRLRVRHQMLRKQLLQLEQTLMKRVTDNLDLTEQAYAQGRIDLDRLMRMHTQFLQAKTRHLEIVKDIAETQIQWSAITAFDLINNYAPEMKP